MPVVLLDGEGLAAFIARTQKVFKMLKASGGDGATTEDPDAVLSANVYLVSVKDDYTLVAYLTKKDKAGSKTMTDGKKARKELPGSKWARGLVRWDGKRFVFELADGNLSAGQARSVVRGQLATDIKISELKKAVFSSPEEPLAPEDTESLDAPSQSPEAPEDTLSWELTADEQAELDELRKDSELTELRASLKRFLTLSEDEAEQQLGTKVQAMNTLLSQLKESPDDESLGQKLVDLHEQILTLAAFGPPVFSHVPGVMEEVGQILNLTAIGMGQEAMDLRLKELNDDFQDYLASVTDETPIEELIARQEAYERLRDDIIRALEGDV